MEKKISSREKHTTKRWNADLQKIEVLFDGIFIDPFNIIDPPSSLVNIATGAVAPKDIKTSLLEALDKGSSMVETFVLERLQKKKMVKKNLQKVSMLHFQDVT